MRPLTVLLLGVLVLLGGVALWLQSGDDAPGIVAAAHASGGAEGPDIGLVRVADGLRKPVFVTHAGDGSGRLFVVEQTGQIRVLDKSGKPLARPFLDVGGLLKSSGGERGLLGLAFHPRYRDNGLFFVAYTGKPKGAHVTARYQVSKDDPNVADDKSGKVLLTIEEPAANHNGGHLAFGKDGYLYIGTGDGGGAGDTYEQSRRTDNLLAKMLRIDVDNGDPYAIPKDNPFTGREGYRPEIWAVGLRNPWRYSFDKKTADLYIADVGQNRYEEVHFQPASSKGGEDYGWNVMEGSRCFRPEQGCDKRGKELPIFEYSHAEGCSVTGGYVYRGAKVPSLEGRYLVADYCSGAIWALARDDKGAWRSELLAKTDLMPSSFGEDEAGELYVTDHQRGAVYRITAPKRAAQSRAP